VGDSEIFLPYPVPLELIEPVSEVRSTLIASSLQALKTRGLLERYTELLPEEFRETILHCIAGQWFTLTVAFAHYRTCDQLGLTIEQQRDIGSDVSRRIHETFLGVLVQMAKGVGITPWTVLGRANQLFSRIVKGGGVQVTKVGPKDALIEIARLPLLEVPYFRTAAQGIYQVAIGMFAMRAHVRFVAAQSRVPGEMTTLHVSWV
jgi:hypothetical protein